MPTTIPVMPSPDLDVTVEWWAQLGFEEQARYPETYTILRGPHDVEIHFFAGDVDPATNDHGGYVRFPSAIPVRRLFDGWSGIDGVHEPQPTDYGLLEGAVKDPHGNIMRFGGRLEGAPSLSALFVDTPGDLDEAADFWAAAFSSRAQSGDGTYTPLADHHAGVDIEVQRIGEGEPRFHIDFAVDDVDAAAEHYEALGARRVEMVDGWWVMRAPTGHLFCLVPR